MRTPRSRVTSAAALTLASVLLAACGEAGAPAGPSGTSGSTTTPEEQTMTSTHTPDGDDTEGDTDGATGTAYPAVDGPVVIEVEATVGSPSGEGRAPSSTGLAVTYTVSNPGSEPVLVARDRGHDQNTTSAGPRDDESVWVSLAPEGDVLRLSKELVPLPEGTEEERETTLGADLVEPGGSATGTAFVLRPVTVDFPDDPQRGERIELLPPTWQLCLTVAPPHRRSDVIGRLTPGQQTVCSAPEPLPDGLA